MWRGLSQGMCLAFVLLWAGPASAELPDGWSSRDIGTTGGSASEDAGTWTVSGDGADVWGKSDAFHFACVRLSGNGQITARVVGNGTGSDLWAKGGVMIRETLTPGSKHALMALTGGEGGGMTFQNRPTTGGNSYSAHGYLTATPPYWVRLTREGNTITAYSSADGVNWVRQPGGMGQGTSANPVTIPMATDVFAGLFVTSHEAGRVRTYTFDQVTVGSSLTAQHPEPENGSLQSDTEVQLRWVSGPTAASHDVYFGASLADVDGGTGGTFRGNQPAASFLVGVPGSPYPEGLTPGTTYYWRIDEVESDGVTKHKGEVWRFSLPAGQAPASAVPTFHCIGLSWSPLGGSRDNVCQVRYRPGGSTAWKEALPLWYDDRTVAEYPRGYRGSIVNLVPGTAYEIKLKLSKTGTEKDLTAKTWSQEFPIAETVYLPAGTTHQTFAITESGTPDGYILYTAPPEGSVIDVSHGQNYCLTVNASYVIIRGLNLKGAREYGIRLDDCHDVIIEQCDISDWGSTEDDGWGNRSAAIRSFSNKLRRIIVQRNKLHHPYSDTNSWTEYRAKYSSYHPRGAIAVGFADSAGNHVIRYNEIYSAEGHYFEDCISGGPKFPNRDSDIYGNYIAHCWDDAIEAEDDDCNIRIWGNFIEWAFVKIAIAPVSVGPMYIWRNVGGVGRQDDLHSWDETERGGFLKTDDGGGKIYVFHNTVLQPQQPAGVQFPLGCSRGLGWGGRMFNVMSRNNILHVCNPKYPSIKDSTGVTYHDALGDYDYDLFNGPLETYPGAEPHGIRTVPRYDPKNGSGEFALYPRSPGVNAGAVLPNFNDNYSGAAPDIGAFETGSPPMEFGVNAHQ
jgi:hypothetical protein